MTGFDGDEREYSLMAERAIQPLASPGQVRLEAIEAKVTAAGQGATSITAEAGDYDHEKSTLQLLGAIAVNSADGYRLRMSGANIDFGAEFDDLREFGLHWLRRQRDHGRADVGQRRRQGHRHRRPCPDRADAAEARADSATAAGRRRGEPKACAPNFSPSRRLRWPTSSRMRQLRISARRFRASTPAPIIRSRSRPIASKCAIRRSSRSTAGNVRVRQGDTILEAPELRVFYSGSGPSMSGGGASGPTSEHRFPASRRVPASVSAPATARRAGDRAVLDMASDLVTLEGNVILTQGGECSSRRPAGREPPRPSRAASRAGACRL